MRWDVKNQPEDLQKEKWWQVLGEQNRSEESAKGGGLLIGAPEQV